MGAFYGSFHVRSADREATSRVGDDRLERQWPLSRRANDRAVDGRIPFRCRSGLRGIATGRRRTGRDIVHVLLHDDDVFAFELYRGGLLVDRDNPDALADGLYALWSDVSLAERLGASKAASTLLVLFVPSKDR